MKRKDLSKYLDEPSSKKRKKKKKKHSKVRLEPATRVHDEEDGMLVARDGEEEEHDEENEEDRPTVVESWEVPAGEGAPAAAAHSLAAGSSKKPRYDSSSEDEPNRAKSGDGERTSIAQRRRRYDSESEESNENGESKEIAGIQRRRRYDSDSDEPNLVKSRDSTVATPRRRRYDSGSEDSNEKTMSKNKAVPQKRRRYDSDSEEPDDRIKSEASVPNIQRRRRYDSDSDESNDTNGRAKTASGHVAGLQSASDFSKAERAGQRRKREEALALVDQYGMGETVHRSTSGKAKVSKGLTDFEQGQLQIGRVQRQEAEERWAEEERIKQAGIARYADDDELEAYRKDQIHVGEDPMAAYALQKQREEKQSKSGTGSNAPTRPVYKGPPPKPNRYGIRPGYRWDGVDRANGWEDKLLAQRYSRNQNQEQAYRWSSADM